jgi:hypothetical protein
MRRSRSSATPIFATALFATAALNSIAAQDKSQAADPAQKPAAAAELNDLEQAFVDQMNGCALIGSFTIDGRDDKPARSERYEIKGATRVKDDNWLIHARIVYGEIDVVVPVPVKMNWAGDTPVLSVTNLAIPLVGEQFTARLLFYDGRYAGTWAHGKVGGHMTGKIEKTGTDKPEEASKPDADQKKPE